MSPRQWVHRGGRPNRAARLIDRITAAIHARGVKPDDLVTLETQGRRSGRAVRFPLVMVVVEGQRRLVSMLGEDATWVRNVRAAGATPSGNMAGARRFGWKRWRSSAARPCWRRT